MTRYGAPTSSQATASEARSRWTSVAAANVPIVAVAISTISTEPPEPPRVTRRSDRDGTRSRRIAASFDTPSNGTGRSRTAMIPAARPASAGTIGDERVDAGQRGGAAGAGDAALDEQVRAEDREDDHERLEQQPAGRGPADDRRVPAGAARGGERGRGAGDDEDQRGQDRHEDRRDDGQPGRAGGQEQEREGRGERGRRQRDHEALDQRPRRSAGRTTRRGPGPGRATGGGVP